MKFIQILYKPMKTKFHTNFYESIIPSKFVNALNLFTTMILFMGLDLNEEHHVHHGTFMP
jgi:hypothetical protein